MKKRIIVSGALANKPGNGGEAWVRLSWILGLKRLGCDVHFIEQLAPENTVDSSGGKCGFAGSGNLAFFRKVTEDFGLTDSASLVWNGGEQTFGGSLPALTSLARQADLLINISGHLTLEPLKNAVRRRAYIDIDPGFTQFWHAAGNPGAHLDGHEFYFTIGENIGRPDCEIPTDGIAWQPVRQPVVLDHWPVCRSVPPLRFSTIANWRGSYGPVEFAGKNYGLKVHEFRKFLSLPRLADAACEIALAIHPADAADLESLRQNGWRVSDPRLSAGDPARFRRFVQDSGAEFSVAQGIYVDTNSGWFSDRTIRYLASGKPALVQDTGFTAHLPAGKGLIAFRTLDEAVAGVHEITQNYAAHCRAARQVAESCFDSDRVLSGFLGKIFHV